MKKADAVLTDILNNMLSKYNRTVDEMKGLPEGKIEGELWYSHYTMTTQEFEEWKRHSVDMIRRELKFSKERAEKEFSMVNLMWGLKIKDN